MPEIRVRAQPYKAKWSKQKFLEVSRTTLAAALLALLAFVVIASFITIWLFNDRAASLETLLTIIFGPVVALVGSALGYYFGGEGRRSDDG